MDRSIRISLELPPEGKARARAALRGGRLAHYTPEKTRTHEGLKVLPGAGASSVAFLMKQEATT